MAKLTGTNPDQVPTNADLGDMAYQSKDNASISKIDVPNEGDLTLNPSGGRVNIGDPDIDDNWLLNVVSNDSADHTLARFRYKPSSTELKIEGVTGTTWVRVLAGGGDRLILGSDNSDDIKIETNGEVQVTSGLLELNGNDIGGTQVTIADDAVASITPPRNGGFMMITCQGDAIYPQVSATGMLFYDVGTSLDAKKLDVFGTYTFGSSDLSVTTGDLTGTTGTDTHVTVSAMSGVIKVENRVGFAANFQITFL